MDVGSTARGKVVRADRKRAAADAGDTGGHGNGGDGVVGSDVKGGVECIGLDQGVDDLKPLGRARRGAHD